LYSFLMFICNIYIVHDEVIRVLNIYYSEHTTSVISINLESFFFRVSKLTDFGIYVTNQ